MDKIVRGLRIVFVVELIQFITPLVFVAGDNVDSVIYSIFKAVIPIVTFIFEIIGFSIASRIKSGFKHCAAIVVMQFIAETVYTILESFEVINNTGVDTLIDKVFDVMLILFTIKIIRDIHTDNGLDDKWFNKATIVILINVALSAVNTLWHTLIFRPNAAESARSLIVFIIYAVVFFITSFVSAIFWLGSIQKGIKVCQMASHKGEHDKILTDGGAI